MIQKLVEIRNKLKSKKPEFIRQDAHKKKRVSRTGWRRPKGRTNKMRLHLVGYRRGCSTGYGSPALVRGLSRHGFTQNVISCLNDFNDLDHKIDGIIFSRTLGIKKKLVLLEHALKNNFTILNLNPEKFKKSCADLIENKKKNKEHLKSRKKSKEAELTKKESKKTSKETENKNEESKDVKSEKIVDAKAEPKAKKTQAKKEDSK